MTRTLGITVLSTLAIILVTHAAGIRPNITHSAPIGLWLDRPITTPLHRGMMIGVCPPPTVPVVKRLADSGTLALGNCPETNVAILLKPIQALPGDTVRISQGNPAVVNGTSLLNTIASETLPAWPDGEYVVKPDEVWIFSSYSEKSFDSRYFGPVKIDSVRSEATPLLTTGVNHD